LVSPLCLKRIQSIPSVPHPVAMTVSAEVVGKFSGGMQTGRTMELKVKGVSNFSKAMSNTSLQRESNNSNISFRISKFTLKFDESQFNCLAVSAQQC